ncbi:hypothetical protein HUG10_17050 [Halorarum halophilum]|uniref:DUF7981 domain-containing protein n=1 Tax=Halorarum halophilum TaxID=2743090 RepID=A0A7D5GDP3_9EURY|nr:hypothetical protein [Halobaculum halophilum]QLG29132.1 hypothetical protein HUG10_17050 [Halobaculum halophilum]
MSPRRKSALLWGVVGALAFLVLAQGAVVFQISLPVGFFGLVSVSLLLGSVVAGVAYATEHRLTGKGQA